ncbi:MAG: CFI-box-CTERM domain-containing protein [Candidatus Omnitrophota bacterium]
MCTKPAEYRIKDATSKMTAILLALSISMFGVSASFATVASDSGGFTPDASATFGTEIITIAGADNDYDGMEDSWEQRFGLKSDNYADASRDDDNDGLTNLEEYRNNTDPKVSEGGIALTMTATPVTDNVQPLDVIFTADVIENGGYDIVKYEWDFDGNGVYDWQDTGASAAHRYTAFGAYEAKLRVTNEKGYCGVAALIINVQKAADMPYIYTKPTLIQIQDVPQNLAFSATNDPKFSAYRWDLNGDGVWDTISDNPSIIHSYRNVRYDSFNVEAVAVADSGIGSCAAMSFAAAPKTWYDSNANKGKARPIIAFLRDKIIISTAGESVSFDGYCAPAYGDSWGYAKKTEWDFESDGIYDWVTSLLDAKTKAWTGNTGGYAKVSHVYGTPGIYRATLRGTTDANVCATDSVLVIVQAAGSNPPNARAKIEYGDKKEYEYSEKTPFLEGTIPFTVTGVHKNSSSNSKYFEWDFDADGVCDWTGADNNPKTKKDTPTYTYTIPGYYLASLKVTDNDGLTDTAYAPIYVSIANDGTHRSAIKSPKEGMTVAGNKLSLIGEVFPDDVSADNLTFQYSPDKIQWFNIPGPVKPLTSYKVAWDTTQVSDGPYFIRLVVNGKAADGFIPASVEVLNNPAADDVLDICENDAIGAYSYDAVINTVKQNELTLYNGARIILPPGAVDDDDNQVGIIVIEFSSISAGIGFAIDITLVREPGADGSQYGPVDLNKDVIIQLPYPDADNNAIVDGTGVNEKDIVIMWKANAADKWEPLINSIVYPDENYVQAAVNHFTLFGAGFLAGGGSVFGSASSVFGGEGAVSYCFIATAAYGCADAEDVMVLRRFRDRFLLTNEYGEKFVNFYYQHSPKVVKYIERSEAFRKIVRLALKPLIKFARWRLNRL